MGTLEVDLTRQVKKHKWKSFITWK